VFQWLRSHVLSNGDGREDEWHLDLWRGIVVRLPFHTGVGGVCRIYRGENGLPFNMTVQSTVHRLECVVPYTLYQKSVSDTGYHSGNCEEIDLLWHMLSFIRLKVIRRFVGKCCFHHQDRAESQSLLLTSSWFLDLKASKIVPLCSAETSVGFRGTRPHKSVDWTVIYLSCTLSITEDVVIATCPNSVFRCSSGQFLNMSHALKCTKIQLSPLSLVSTTEELLGRKVASPV
jgi:hypothetical protein